MQNAVLAADEATHNPLIPEASDVISSLIIFIVLLIVVWRVVLPRFQHMLDERSAAIEGNVEKADEAHREAEAVLEQYNAQLAGARAEANAIRDQARNDGTRILAEARDTATAEAARINATAKQQIEAERAAASASLRAEVGSLAIDLASSIVGEHLADDTKSEAVVDRFLADLERSEATTSASASEKAGN
jgi:F-type H+-transporting ATPase subunit b